MNKKKKKKKTKKKKIERFSLILWGVSVQLAKDTLKKYDRIHGLESLFRM
jgi:hypothetical protein